MDIDKLIEQLEFLRKKYGNLNVVLDDFYTRSSRFVDFVGVEPREGDKEMVVVLRD